MSARLDLTYTGIGLAVFSEQLGLPVPAVLLLMSAGALAAQGQGHLQVRLVLVSAVVGSLLADGFWFWLGRRWGSGVIRLVCSLTSDPKHSRERSQEIFDRWGLRLLLVAKFVPGLDGVSPPLAGAEGATTGGFVAYDAAGALLWSSAYVGAGYLFSNQLDAVIGALARFGAVVMFGVGVPLALFVAWRGLHLVRVIRHLRLRRISPAMLQAKMESSDRVAVVDLLDYEAKTEVIAGIPGAFRVDPKVLRKAPKLHVPEGVDVVLYCSSRNEFVSARVADTLEKHGFADVWVLEGGLAAWVLDGRPVTTEMPTLQEMARRLRIELPPPKVQ